LGIFIPFLFFSQPAFPQTPLPSDAPFWRKAVAGVVIGKPQAQAGSVVVAVDGGSIKAYSWNGSFLWEYFAQGKILPYLTRSWDGQSFICRTNGILIAVNRVGRELWRVNLRSPLVAPVQTGWDGRLFVPTDRKISCFNNAGKPLWAKSMETTVALHAGLDKRGGLMLVLDNAKLLQIDAFGGIRLKQLKSVPVAVISLSKNASGAAEDAALKETIVDVFLVIYQDGSTETIGIEAIGKEAEFPHLPAAPIAVKESGSMAAILLANGTLLAFTETGKKLWQMDTRISSEAEILIDSRGVFVLSQSRCVAYALSGAMRWSLDIARAITFPAFSDEGVIYSGGSDWILYAYQLERYGAGWKPSIYGARPQGEYGLGGLPLQMADYYSKFSDYELSSEFAAINEKLKQGNLGEDEPRFAEYLKEAAASARNSQSATNPPVHLSRRIAAVRLLSSFGSEELVPFFADLLLADKEPLVKAAAADAIGRIGVDPEGLAMKAFERLVSSSGTGRNEQALAAVASAIGSLCRYSGPPMSALGVPILAALAAKDKPPLARKIAMQELRNLQKE
jgi:outer membrane protein assembly factor BamB